MMIKKLKILSLILIPVFLWSCEDEIFPALEEADPQIVIDAWINNNPEPQQIRITETLPYYDAVKAPEVEGAIVYIIDNENNTRYDFNEKLKGFYEWEPSVTQPRIGSIGSSFDLYIEIEGIIFTASTTLNRVPQIDSISFRFEPESFLPEGYYAQFYANDFVGPGDTYWIKAYKNNKLLNKPNEINIAFDAGFTAGGQVDGIPFIQPIREGINPFDTDEDDALLPPYLPGDSVHVELYSITNEAFIYLNELKIQTDRPGGFAELFAVPLSNIPSNIRNENQEGSKPLGFFNVSAMSSMGKWLDPEKLPE
ncbi:DUF4249 domain-containing protein [Bacteroidota bacterium]